MLLPVQEASVFHSIPPPMIQTAVSDYLLSGLSRSLDSNPDGDSYPPGLDAVLKYYGLSTATPGQYRPGCAFQKRTATR